MLAGAPEERQRSREQQSTADDAHDDGEWTDLVGSVAAANENKKEKKAFGTLRFIRDVFAKLSNQRHFIRIHDTLYFTSLTCAHNYASIVPAIVIVVSLFPRLSECFEVWPMRACAVDGVCVGLQTAFLVSRSSASGQSVCVDRVLANLVSVLCFSSLCCAVRSCFSFSCVRRAWSSVSGGGWLLREPGSARPVDPPAASARHAREWGWIDQRRSRGGDAEREGANQRMESKRGERANSTGAHTTTGRRQTTDTRRQRTRSDTRTHIDSLDHVACTLQLTQSISPHPCASPITAAALVDHTPADHRHESQDRRRRCSSARGAAAGL